MNAVVSMDVLTSAKTYQGHTGAYVMLDILYKLMKGSVEVCILYYNNMFLTQKISHVCTKRDIQVYSCILLSLSLLANICLSVFLGGLLMQFLGGLPLISLPT